MKVIFLDFDGVLNSADISVGAEDELWSAQQIEVRHVVLLNQLLAQSGASVVISSSWRKILPSTEALAEILRSRGFSGTVIGMTPALHRTADGEPRVRGHEIAQWLAEHPEVGEHVILDDDAEFLRDQETHLVRTDPASGLTEDDVTRALRILSGDGRAG